MRVLMVCVPQAGHVDPLLPLLSALVAEGDEVLVASGAAVRERVAPLGAAFHPAGRDLPDWFARLGARTRGRPGDGLPPGRIAHYFFPRLFAEIGAEEMIDEVLAAGEAFRPDLVVFDSQAFAGPLAAALLGVPGVHHTIGVLPEPEVLQLASDAISPLWRSFGRDVPAYAGLFAGPTVLVCPPSLQRHPWPAERLLHVQPAAPPQRREPAAPPLVYVTLGTVWANADVLRAILQGLADEPVEVVVTSGALDPAELGPAPPNARVERYVPQAELLPRCAAVVHHAGAGTMFGALAHGLPQVAVPRAADNFSNAEVLAAAGVAQALQPAEVSAAAVREAVRTVLADGSFRTAAEAVAAEIAAMPGPAELRRQLRGLVGR